MTRKNLATFLWQRQIRSKVVPVLPMLFYTQVQKGRMLGNYSLLTCLPFTMAAPSDLRYKAPRNKKREKTKLKAQNPDSLTFSAATSKEE